MVASGVGRVGHVSMSQRLNASGHTGRGTGEHESPMALPSLPAYVRLAEHVLRVWWAEQARGRCDGAGETSPRIGVTSQVAEERRTGTRR